MEMTIHCMSWQLLCQCLSSHVWQREYFSNWIQNTKSVVLAVHIAPFLSQSNKTLPNACFASEPYSLLSMVSLETFQSGWFRKRIYAPAEKTKLSSNSTNLALFHGAAFTLSAQKEVLCVMFKPIAVPSVNVSIIISEISIWKEIFKRKRNVQLTTTRAHFYPPFCFSQNSSAVAS